MPQLVAVSFATHSSQLLNRLRTKTKTYATLKNLIPYWGCCFCLAFISQIPVVAQSISGYVLTEDNDPIPYVNIFVKELNTGTSTDNQGRYFLNIDVGDYLVVFSSVGYETKSITMVVRDAPIVKNVYLKASNRELEDIVVRASRKDPAYEIIQKVIDNRKSYLAQVTSSKRKVYVKATEQVDIKERERKKEKKMAIDASADYISFGPKKEIDPRSNLNMVEMYLELNYKSPDHYKEERTGHTAYGNQNGLFLPQFSETDFNFYHNQVELTGIAEAPMISPISRTAILAYKYKLESSTKEGPYLVHKIKVIPRKTSNSSAGGYLYINDRLWNINRLDLTLPKGSLKFYDQFRLKQDYQQIEDSLWIPFRQEFIYETKQGRYKNFKGSTVLHYSEYEKNYVFPKKFFGNEVASTTKEALERDSSYWNSTRPEALTTEQMAMIHYRDSIESVHKSQDYLDSLEAQYNKITLGEALIHGFGFRNTAQKRHLFVSSLLSLVNFEVIGGWRLGPYFFYNKLWENGKLLSTSSNFSIGLKNTDLQGNARIWYRYDPFRLGSIQLRIGRNFASINSYDAYLNQLKRSNFILNDHIGFTHRIELFNGFYLHTEANLNDRKSIEDYNSTTFITDIINDEDPLAFENYQAFVTDLKLSYTPKQKYMREPNRKVVLGSSFPTFSATHKKGWPGPFSSDINFDYLDLTVEQDIVLGIFGNSKYSLQLGKFINTKDLRFVDFKRFRESDPYLYSDPLHSFQLLDTSLITTDLFFEAHHIHHFNGALVNNIPLIKKLKVRVVAGIGVLWVKENNYRHEELFAGLERVFKIGARRRLRLGIYGVVSESNQTKPATDFKISFDVIDTWKKDWSY